MDSLHTMSSTAWPDQGYSLEFPLECCSMALIVTVFRAHLAKEEQILLLIDFH